ncbi:MAG: hypothetical protein AMXMBFR13_27920 [Phycisphaerae bacterium]
MRYDFGRSPYVLSAPAVDRLSEAIQTYHGRIRPCRSAWGNQVGVALGWFSVRSEDLGNLTSALAAYLFNPANLRRDPDLLGCPYPREAEWAKAELNRQRMWQEVKGCLSDEVAGDPLAVIDGLARGEA